MDIIAQDLAAQARSFATTAMAALMEKRSAHLSPANMTAWNRAKARVRAGVADATVAFVGDSTTVGHGAGDDPINNFNNARNRSMPSRAAQQLVAMGLPANAEAVFGGGTIDSASTTLTKLQLYNPQLNIASSGTSKWFTANEYTLGGRMMRSAGVATDLYSLTPSMPFDTMDLYYAGGFASTTFTVDVGGEALQTFSTTGSAGLTKATVSTGAAAAVSTINLKNTGGQMFRLIGIILRNTQVRQVQMLNLGWEGARTGDWASASGSAGYAPTSANSWAPDKALASLAPDLTIVKLGANDVAASIPVATCQANLQTIIAAAKTGGGSVILVTPTPQNPATRDPAGLTTAYNAMLHDVAGSNGCGLIDLHTRYMSWASANGQGYFSDDVHSLPVGYANEGDIVARALFDS
ncbi:SGNH/GDSL hydrolase family protein [Sphingobium sp.]|uniref:SGNH/GDSL hydrolase family protein n=1 Tax=Sphingobium sp. TaxID=1912891 RepID=UPI003BB71EC2